MPAPPHLFVQVGQRIGRGVVIDASVRLPRRDRPASGAGVRGARLRCRAALEAAAPLLAEAWAPAPGRPRPRRQAPAAFMQANTLRQRANGHQQAGSATMILARFGPALNPSQRAVAEARAASPGASWTEIGAGLGMTKDQAVGHWRRGLEKARKRMEAADADRT